ncbi:MAG: cytidine deaminase [Flavobacteriales bacterium]|nr:cytidine deaminase [Flavobacteriales bacterium]
MKNTREIAFQYEVYESVNDLQTADQELVSKAFEALRGSYAPYSRFHVGAAVLLADGEVVCGANQENAAYPSGLCAERVAVFAAKAQKPDVDIDSIAIVIESENAPMLFPSSPCGACRQSLLEYEVNQDRAVRLILATRNSGAYVVPSIKSLLPLFFDQSQLGK